jgi:hypothetical protein
VTRLIDSNGVPTVAGLSMMHDAIDEARAKEQRIVEIAYEVDFDFPFRTQPHLNTRVPWIVSHAKKKTERDALHFAWIAAGRPVPPLPATITFVRIAPRPLDEGDNLPSAFKAMRDELAKRLGVNDDRKAPVTWLYAQERGAPRTYAVRVEMRGTLRRRA